MSKLVMMLIPILLLGGCGGGGGGSSGGGGGGGDTASSAGFSSSLGVSSTSQSASSKSSQAASSQGKDDNTFLVSVGVAPVDGGTVGGGSSYTKGTLTTVYATPKSGYRFVNWRENGEVVSTNAFYGFVVQGERQLVAHFQKLSQSTGTTVVVPTYGYRPEGRKVATDAQSNIYIAGINHDVRDEDEDGNPLPLTYFVAKYTADQEAVFQETFLTQHVDQSPSITGINIDADGNLLVMRMEDTDIGRVESETYPKDGLQFPIVHKLSSAGETLDEFSLELCDADAVELQVVNDFILDNEGHLIIAGYCLKKIGGDREGFVAKYTASGEMLFIKYLINDGPKSVNYGLAVTVDDEDNIYLVGNTIFEMHGYQHMGGKIVHGNGSGTSNFHDLFMVKFNKNGDRLFTVMMGKQHVNVEPRDVAMGIDGKVWVVGETQGIFIGNRRYGTSDYFVAQLDKDNVDNPLVHQFGAKDGAATANSVVVDDEGNAYVSGYTVGGILDKQDIDAFFDELLLAKYTADGSLVGMKTFGEQGKSLSPGSSALLKNDDEIVVALRTSEVDPELAPKVEVELFKDSLEFPPLRFNDEPGSGPGDDDDDDNDDGGGNDDQLDWKDNWLFVQSDKAVQYRLAKVREEGPHFIFRIQYRVNSEDSIYHPSSNGYHLYRYTDAPDDLYYVYFPASFKGLEQIYELEREIALFVDGIHVDWDPNTNQLIYLDPAYRPSSGTSCVDDNSSESRCERNYWWSLDEVDHDQRYMAY